MIIQTFFFTDLSSRILQDIKELLESPGDIIGLLASSLPSQSTFFIQLSFVSTTTTFLMEGLGIVRLAKALARKFIGPHLTERERRMPVFGTLQKKNVSFLIESQTSAH